MKLSICIPIHNFDVSELVLGLKQEIIANNIDAEIILIDDASDDFFKEINKKLVSEVENLIFLQENIGRAKIRNLFLKYTVGEYLLFLDCDAKIFSKNFLKNYIEEITKSKNIDFIYGNFMISEENTQTLRNQYSLQREIFKGERSYDYSYFKTVNFVVEREIFRKFPFDESLRNYGYEDYFFAQKLKMANVNFVIINNPVIHYDNTSNAIFLQKAKEAVNTLYLFSQNPKNKNLVEGVKLYKMAQKVKKMRLKSIFLKIYSIFDRKIMSNLTSEKPNIHYFDIFKLKTLLEKL